jgi:hypothetical protein
MLADAEHGEPDLVGQLDLLEQIAQPPAPVDPAPSSAKL